MYVYIINEILQVISYKLSTSINSVAQRQQIW